MPQGKISPPPDNLDKSTRLFNWEDRTGHRIGRMVVIGWAGRGPWGKSKGRNWWTVQCECGTITSLVLTRNRQSCGCRQRVTQKMGPARQREKNMALIEKHTGKKLTLQEAARLYHVKHSSLRWRMWKWPDDPTKWGMTRKRPPNLKKRAREYAEPGVNRAARAAARRRGEGDDRQRGGA